MSERTQRSFATIVSADVVEDSRLFGAEETGTLAAPRAALQVWGGKLGLDRDTCAGWRAYAAGVGLALLILGGCAQIGPASISHGRGAYNEVITKTDDEQSLTFIVRLRYGLTTNLLTVASITANVRFRANAAAQVGVGPNENYVGNLVPLSGGVAFEENPTISYLPVRSDKHLRQILSPIPIDILALLFNVIQSPGSMLAILVSNINKTANPDFAISSDSPQDQGFLRLVDLVDRLGTTVQFVQGQADAARFYLWIHD